MIDKEEIEEVNAEFVQHPIDPWIKFGLIALIFVVLAIMACLCTSCQALPQLFQATEDIADDTAVKVEVSREAIAKETDVSVDVKVTNKDQPKAKS